MLFWVATLYRADMDKIPDQKRAAQHLYPPIDPYDPVSYTHLTLPTNREV